MNQYIIYNTGWRGEAVIGWHPVHGNRNVSQTSGADFTKGLRLSQGLKSKTLVLARPGT